MKKYEAEELFEEGELEEEFVEEPDIEMEGELPPEIDLQELKVALPQKPMPQPPPPEPAALTPPPTPRRVAPAPKPIMEEPKPEVEPALSDAAAVQKAMSTIIAKLSSMEGLLARIEKHLRKP